MTTPHIDWIGKRALFFAVSGALFLASVALLATKGFNYGIDFTGGTVVQVGYESERPLSEVRKDLAAAGFADAQPQSFAGGKSFVIFMKGREGQTAALADEIVAGLQKAGAKFVVERKDFVGPTVGRHLRRQATKAIVFALLAIVLYIAFRFQHLEWGAAAVAAIAHDVTILAGVFCLLQLEMDLLMVAAFLTIAGYSTNDTIVIFDRMRENLLHRRGLDFRELVNSSINECLSRTVITNGMVLAVVVALLALGGPVIRNFALAMTIGAVLGTYSTIAVAMQLMYLWTSGPRRSEAAAPRAKAKPVKK